MTKWLLIWLQMSISHLPGVSPVRSRTTSNAHQYLHDRKGSGEVRGNGVQNDARALLPGSTRVAPLDASPLLKACSLRAGAPRRVICLQYARWWSFFMMLFNPQWEKKRKGWGWEGGMSSRAPDKLAPAAISVGYWLLYLSTEAGVNLSCDLYSALCATLTWR